MKNIYLLLISFLITFSVQSQRNPESTYISTFAYKAKDGMVDKFEKAVAKKTKMFNTEEGRMGVVVTFLAVLELLKDSLLEIVQSEEFGPIYIKGIEEIH